MTSSTSGEGASFLPVMARRTSLAASSRASTEACSLYQDVCGVQIRLGASFSGPAEKLAQKKKVLRGGNACGGTRGGGGLAVPEGLRLVDVQGGASYPALLQGLGQRFLVHQAAS